MSDFKLILDFIRASYPDKKEIYLHEPVMGELEEFYVKDCIRSGFVSSVGEYVVKTEEKLAEIAGTDFAVCVSSGTAALHTALLVAGVKPGDVVLTQSLSFVATANAIKYCNAEPLFIDINNKTLSLSPDKLEEFFENFTEEKNGEFFLKKTSNRISACVPMHTFGHIGDIERICEICKKYNVIVIEDAAEALGSRYKGKHAGTFGKAGIFSFNGNKIVTSGGGGAIVTDDKAFAQMAKHISTTARKDKTLAHEHDMVGYNYRMPNLNASFLYAQLLQLDDFLTKKRKLAKEYINICNESGLLFFNEPENCISNFWLNSIFLENEREVLKFLEKAKRMSIFPRIVWKPLHMLEIFKKNHYVNLEVTEYIYNRTLNLPSSVQGEG